ncbi:MAG: hypothetical protein DCF29_16005, partial [Alphaproteobacteria bacterium]
MSLKAIVAALGGELYQGGQRATVPAPGHSPHDRSISLCLIDDRVLVHSFGGTHWRDARRDLQARGLVDAGGRLAGVSGKGPTDIGPPASRRRLVAASLWEAGLPIGDTAPSHRYLARRAVRADADNLRHHPHVPVSVYRPGSFGRAALIARISDAADQLTGVELVYLEPNGLPASGLRVPRKTMGQVPPGAAVRLAPAACSMLVGEGVCTTLSAMERFGRPGWALRSAHNLAAWSPPPDVEDVLIAGDRGKVGEAAARCLCQRLVRMGLQAAVVLPPPSHDDWNDVAVADARPRRRE